MSKDKRKGWLRELKEGDLVYVHQSPIHGYSKEEITEITSEGTLKTEFYNFHPDGTAICDPFGGFRPHLQEETKEFLDKLDKFRISKRLNNMMWKWIELDIEKLREIEKVLEK